MSFSEGLVSVIIPVFNRPVLLQETVESVLSQDYGLFEVIIVDDGSTDETPQVIGRLIDADSRIRSKRIPNGGPGAAREAGRQLVRGEFIQYLDSDDLLLPGKFAIQTSALNKNPGAGIAYGKTATQVIGSATKFEPIKDTGIQRDTLFPSLLKQRWWSTSTPLFRRSVCDLAGPWMALQNEEDWEYEARIASHGVQLTWIDQFVSVTRDHEQERSSEAGSSNPAKLRDRCLARIRILQHAITAGVNADQPDFDHFIKSSFLVVRQAALADVEESGLLLRDLLRTAPFPKMRAYDGFSRLVGRKTASMFYQKTFDLLAGRRG